MQTTQSIAVRDLLSEIQGLTPSQRRGLREQLTSLITFKPAKRRRSASSLEALQATLGPKRDLFDLTVFFEDVSSREIRIFVLLGLIDSVERAP